MEKDKVAQIITFGTLGAKAALKDVGRVLDIPLAEVNKIASLIPTGPKVTLEDSYDKIAQLKELVNSRPENVKLFHFARKLEGLLRNPSTHAAGVIISREPLQSVIPLTNDRKRESDLLITQFEGQHLEACGLLKMDFLGLKNLTMIQKCIDLIKINHNIDNRFR